MQADWSQTFATTLGNEVLIELNLDKDRISHWTLTQWKHAFGQKGLTLRKPKIMHRGTT